MGYRVLILDDEAHIAEGIANIFPWEQIGFSSCFFSNPILALSYIRDNPVDVLMCDIEMPGLNGFQLLESLKEEGIELKIVIISSHQHYDYLRMAILYGVKDYLLKPLKSEELFECFEKIKRELDERNEIDTDNVQQGYYEAVTEKISSYISEHYQDATLEDAARLVNLSPSYLSRILKEHSEQGFQDMLLRVRMDKARELLTDIHYKSYDIAYYIGYDNPKSFSRAFKRFWGVSPMEYRNGNMPDRG